ncbi:Spy/CpxP family protein refolding chaperone [Legionella fairfieldensis]|uniref:Spy/CpxP family protein refolding chaperone n=1 Tax=Legionella fairfieldensis TaxID=45064 RepID=UPI000491F195|nr:Spy/CpxP family protein refolding chaperone [Legionella fairfieldensis]
MNKKFRFIAFAFSLILSQLTFAETAAPATAATQQSTSCGCNGDKMKHMIDSLKLDEAQQTKLQTIKEQTKATIKANWQQMKALRSQMNQLIQSDTIDQTKLDSLINQKKELVGNMIKVKIMAKHQIYNLLNAQQKTQYQQMINQWEDNGMHHRCH